MLDNAGRAIQTQNFDAPNNPATSHSAVYDGLNRVLQSIDANGRVTRHGAQRERIGMNQWN